MNMDKQFLIDKFNSFFHSNKNDFFLFYAPGRVNLIGEHTDYTGGFIFAAGIDRGTYILAKKNDSASINTVSLNFEDELKTIKLEEKLLKNHDWADYIKGVLYELQLTGKSFDTGFDCVIYGNIPNGSGLSSSASLELAFIVTFLGINGYNIPEPGSAGMIDCALLAQRCENNFVGVNCGIMDQFVVANAKSQNAIKLNCNDLSFEYRKINLGKYGILIANTNKKRRLEDSQYNTRRSECENGFKLLEKLEISASVLGEVRLEDWENAKNNFSGDDVIKKRLEHVIGENERVRLAFIALKNDKIDSFAKLLNASGDSLRYNFEVTGFHLDALVDAARDTEGVIAARMTGAGFGGCTVNIIDNSLSHKIIKNIEKKYYNVSGIMPEFYLFEIGDGASTLKL